MRTLPTPIRRLIRNRLAVLCIAAFGCLAVWGLVDNDRAAAADPDGDVPIASAPRLVDMGGEPAVRLSEKARVDSGIEVAVLSPARFRATRTGYGVVLDPVRLTEISLSLAQARAQVQIVEARLSASKSASERSRALYRNRQNISLAQSQADEAAFRSDQASLAAGQAQLHAALAAAYSEFGPVLGRALLEGTPAATRLVERQEFLIQVTWPEVDARWTAQEPAIMEGEGMSPASLKFVSMAARSDPRVQGVSFLYAAPADSLVLPGMNVQVSHAAGPPIDGVSVPAGAIVLWQDQAWVYRQTAADLFVRTRLSTSLQAGGSDFIVASLKAGTKVVTRGAQLLLSEEFRAQLSSGED